MLDKNSAVLVIVDVQGKLATLMHEKEAFFDKVVKTIKCCQVMGIPIFWNEQLPDKLGVTIPEIKESLPEMKPLVKETFSCCGNKDFLSRLKETGKDQVLLIGMETHVCVYQTAMDFLNKDYDVYLLADAVSSRSLENKEIAISTMQKNGVNISSLEMAVFEMLGVAQGDEFKQVIKIIK